MTKDGGRRSATATGAMLADPHSLGNLPAGGAESLFDPAFWQARGELSTTRGGRGSAWFIAWGGLHWVLRHFRRGGFIAHLSQDRYVWAGEEHVRAFAEWRLLCALRQQNLPVPKPIAARYERSNFFYRCDLITERIPDAQSLSDVMSQAAVPRSTWLCIGTTLARLHGAGVDHADLNAHNLLLDVRGAVSVIDFDRCRVRAPGSWRARNLRRLHRSLLKIASALPPDRFTPAMWEWLLSGYAASGRN